MNTSAQTSVQESNSQNVSSRITILNANSGEGNANTFVYNMLKGSILNGVSDIHIDLSLDENGQMGFKLRYRIDGQCRDEGFSTDITLYRGIVNKLKLDAGLKIDERRLPQDGRISFELEGKVYNFRLSFMPNTIRNAQEEKIVLRQMADVKKCNLYDLGILKYYVNYFEEAIKYPNGFICVTGPTGSGKTTLLYSLLLEIDRAGKNVMTLEDPIEAEIPLVNQSQMFHRIGYDFGSALRVILRQDPDIIMVGEMRDEETASKAFEAANTGHLVFSTLHTNSAASSITRLLQMQVPYYFISSSLKLVVAQRLVRRVCVDCKTEHSKAGEVYSQIKEAFSNSSKEVQDLLNQYDNSYTIYKASDGNIPCKTCNGTGFKGRTGILEVMKMDDSIRQIINFEKGDERKIEKSAIKGGMLTMLQYGYLQVLKGVTTFDEVHRAVHSG